MSFIKRSDYLRENKVTRKILKKTPKTKWVIRKDEFEHCPRLCQQKSNGSYGKKTYDPKTRHCFECNYNG